jgi:uncharacterized repeat protein (TIGR02543 family)
VKQAVLEISGDAKIYDNHADYGLSGAYVCNSINGCGGAINVTAGILDISGGQIFDNSAPNYGGAIAVQRTSASVFTMSGGVIANNTSSQGGGIWAGVPVTITGGMVIGNTATGTSGYAAGVSSAGGGLFIETSTYYPPGSGWTMPPDGTTLGGSAIVTGNSADTDGGGVYVHSTAPVTIGGDASIGGAVTWTNPSTNTTYTFDGNTAGRDGGGIWVYPSNDPKKAPTQLTVDAGVQFAGNSAASASLIKNSYIALYNEQIGNHNGTFTPMTVSAPFDSATMNWVVRADPSTGASVLPHLGAQNFAFNNYDINYANPFVTVTFNSQGGNPELESDQELSAVGSTADEPLVPPTKPGFVFSGWYSLCSSPTACTKPLYDFPGTPVTEDETLYALWVPASLTITQQASLADDVNGDGRAQAGDSVVFTITVTNPASSGATVSGATLTSESSTVDWSTCSLAADTDGTFRLAPGETVTCDTTTYTLNQIDVAHGNVTSDATATGDAVSPDVKGLTQPVASVSASASEDTYVVLSFDTQGGSPDPADQVVTSGDPANVPAPPGKPGLTFLDWCTNPGPYTTTNPCTPYDFTTPVEKDTTVYASWSALPLAQMPKAFPRNDTIVVSTTAEQKVSFSGDPFTVKVTAGTFPTMHGTVTLDEQGNYTYTPDPGYSGPDGFTYTVTDKNGSDQASVDIMVTPFASDDHATTTAGNPVVIKVTGNDSGTSLMVVSVTDGTNGTVEINSDGPVTYTPKSGFTGTDAFMYAVEDSSRQIVTATVSLTVMAPGSTAATGGSMLAQPASPLGSSLALMLFGAAVAVGLVWRRRFASQQ